jgi:S-adenosylmethionine:tRNA ribosyltransferase-isomerase
MVLYYLLRVWEEDEKSDGNGTECMVRVLGTISMEEYLHVAGTVPIPPYFHRAAEASDKESYNNVYAAADGSVAAPTAGLHFTEQVLTDLGAENCSFLSLHVGAGTFKPVLVSDARDHIMHAETFSVSVREIKRIIAAMDDGKPILAVGTTSSRTLESLYWCGVQRLRGMDTDRHHLVLDQFDWIPWMVGETATRRSAFQSLVEGLEDSDVISGKTSLMIVPGSYEFRVVDHLVTNFHAPDSTLMLLVSAFLQSGEKVKSVYDEAQRGGYRFLSYGDVCMFSRPGSSK